MAYTPLRSDLELLSVLKHLHTKKTVMNSPIKPNMLSFSDQNMQTDPNNSEIHKKKFIKVHRKGVNHSSPQRNEGRNLGSNLNLTSSPTLNKTQPNIVFSPSILYSQQQSQKIESDLNENEVDGQGKVRKTHIYFPHYYFPNSKIPKHPGTSQSSFNQTNPTTVSPLPQVYTRKSSGENFSRSIKVSLDQLINPEEIILLEEKISSIMTFVTKGKEATIPCCDWWSFYIASSLLQNQTLFFQDQESKVVVHSSSNAMMLAVILCYDISDEDNLYFQLNLLFKTIFTLLHLNSLLIFKYIFGQLNHGNKLISEFDNYLYERLNGEAKIEMDEINVCNIIKHNSTSIIDLTKLILNNYYQSGVYRQLMFYFHNITKITAVELNTFFIHCIYQAEKHSTRSLTVRVSPNNISESVEVNPPYLPPKDDKKEYTLILDLDETIVSYAKNKDNGGLLILRPGLIECLSMVKEYYEIVLFTTSIKEYADPIINAIERNQKFFDYRLYRNHTTLVGNDRVKDLSKIGRELSRIVIVDNLSDNYKLQKENGVLIHPFYGDNLTDSSLCQLTLFLIKIAKEATDSNSPDLRKLLTKYHNEITINLSSNLHRLKVKDQINPIILNLKPNQKKIEMNLNNLNS